MRRLREAQQARRAAVLLGGDDDLAPELLPVVRRRLVRLAMRLDNSTRDVAHLGAFLRRDEELVESLRVPNPGPVAEVMNRGPTWWTLKR